MTNCYGDNRLAGLSPFANYTKEMSMTAGLLCLYGLLNLIPGVYELVRVTIDGQDWSGDEDVYPPVVLHLASLIQVTFSLMSLIVGFQYLVSSGGSAMWTGLSAMLSLFSFFTFAVMVSHVAFLAAKETWDFIPLQFDASTKENRSVATLGVLGYIAYAATNFGAIVHLNFKMWRFQGGNWSFYNSGFYKTLLMFFGFLTLLAGVVHLALGAYVYDKVDNGKLVSTVLGATVPGTIEVEGPSVVPFIVTYSEVSMTVACFQVLLGCYILWRAMMRPESEGHRGRGLACFQTFAWFVLVLSICMQVLTQSAMARSSRFEGYAAQLTCLVVGLGLFPIYLDSMYYTTPETVEDASFSHSAPWKKEGIDEEQKRENEPATAAAHATTAAQASV